MARCGSQVSEPDKLEVGCYGMQYVVSAKIQGYWFRRTMYDMHRGLSSLSSSLSPFVAGPSKRLLLRRG